MAAPSIPNMRGNRRRPDSVGLTFFTSWRKSGRKVSAPNMAKPMTKPMELAAVKTRSRNSLRGMTGSLARCSTRRKRRVSTMPPTTSATLLSDPQLHEMPPRLAKRMSSVAAPDSIRTRGSRWRGAPAATSPGSTAPVTKKASTPRGRLM